MAVGDGLKWPTGNATLQLTVRQRGLVTLQVDRAGFQGGDYRCQASGDEQYAPGNVDSTYTLSGEDGQALMQRTYRAGAVAQQLLFMGYLNPGAYSLSLSVTGQAKRAVSLTATGPLDVTAQSINATVRGRAWAALSAFETDQPVEINIFNGDSRRELELRVRYQDGRTLAFPASARGVWSAVSAPAGAAVIEARQGATPRQWSKSLTVQMVAPVQGGQIVPQVLQRWEVTETTPTTVSVPTQVVTVQTRPATVLVVEQDHAPPMQITDVQPGVQATTALTGDHVPEIATNGVRTFLAPKAVDPLLKELRFFVPVQVKTPVNARPPTSPGSRLGD